MIQIEIKSAEVRNQREYRGAQWGEQEAALHCGGDYPLRFKINRKASEPFKPGRYVLGGDSFVTDKHGNLKLGRVRLEALPTAAAAK